MNNNKLHGVFVWNENGIYRAEHALKIYKMEHAAKKHADKLNAAGHATAPGGYVVRWVWAES